MTFDSVPLNPNIIHPVHLFGFTHRICLLLSISLLPLFVTIKLLVHYCTTYYISYPIEGGRFYFVAFSRKVNVASKCDLPI